MLSLMISSGLLDLEAKKTIRSYFEMIYSHLCLFRQEALRIAICTVYAVD